MEARIACIALLHPDYTFSATATKASLCCSIVHLALTPFLYYFFLHVPPPNALPVFSASYHMSAPRLRDGGGGSAPPAGSTATSATIAAPAVAPAVGAAGATANASAASAPAAGGVAGKKNANTIDALTATLQSSKLADGATSGDRLATMDNDAIKTLLLDTTTEAGEGLSVCLHDHIWANGGEAVLRLGLPPRTYEEQEHFKHDIDGIEAVDRCFTEDELELAVKNVVRACQDAEGQATVLCRGQSPQSSYAYLMLRRIPAGAQELLELRIAVIGNVDAGKSSTLGVLTKGGLDDGRGKARVNLFRHKHEIESGRTSSVGMEIMGFDSEGEVVTNAEKGSTEPGRKMSWEEVCARSAKVISFIVSTRQSGEEQLKS